MIAYVRQECRRPPGRVFPAALATLAALAAAALLLNAGGASGGGAPPAPPQYFMGHSADRWPSDTLRDWAGYADQVSAISVVAQRRIPSPDLVRDGGYENRMITVRVDETLWTRPGAPTVEGSFEMLEWGFFTGEDGVRRRFIVENAVWPEVGKRYIAPLVRSDEGDWTFLSSAAIAKVNGDRADASVDVGTPTLALRAISGHSHAEVGAVMRATKPSAAAEKHAELPPEARFRAVARGAP